MYKGRALNRIISGLGTLLVLFGVALLAYVGITYARSTSVPSRSWTAAQALRGKKLAHQLSHHQRVAIPTSSVKNGAGPTGPAVRIVIPKINVDSTVVQSPPVNGIWNVADWAVGHLATTPNPGAVGNGAYAAHDDIKGEIFKRLPELAPGDRVLLYTHRAAYLYIVVRQLTVDPSNVKVLAPTAQPTVTLVSCVPYWVDSQRIIVQAVLKSSTAA